jgi:hypothetical protein
MGLTGEPVAPSITSGAITSWNSHRFSAANTAASVSSSALSARGSRLDAGRGRCVGELPSVHGRADLDPFGAAQMRDVVEHATRDDAVAPVLDRARAARGHAQWTNGLLFQYTPPPWSCAPRWLRASMWV